MAKRAELISSLVRERLGSGPADVAHAEIGHVISIGDGIARVSFAQTTTVAAAA
jgi:hypothetical protein